MDSTFGIHSMLLPWKAHRGIRKTGSTFPHGAKHPSGQLDLVALRGGPIIALISFLVGGIIAQQEIFQLHRFGATSFAVDLVGIFALWGLGVLLTSIMIVGRSGLAITAEIRCMKMREEIAALVGGGVAWIYEGISPNIFLSRLRDAIALNTFLVGLMKSPFRAPIIGLISAIEGFEVQVSAESLGRHVI